jgi:hypothetical protein
MVALSDAVPYYVLAVGAVGARVGLITARPCTYFGMSSVTVAELGTVPVDVYQTTVAVFVELNVYGQNVTPVSLDTPGYYHVLSIRSTTLCLGGTGGLRKR